MSRRPHNHARRRRILLAGLLVGALLMLGRGMQLQVIEGDRWATRAADQQRQRLPLPAPRGAIYDRDGVPLAASQEAYRIAIAPGEVKDRAVLERRLREVLRLSAAEARRAMDRRRRWVVLPGRYDAVARGQLEGMRGVHFERVLERFYPHGGLAAELLGAVSPDGRALGGIELEFDSLLSGQPGFAVVRRDGRGEPIPGAMVSVVEPVPGHDLVLTLDHDLQEIAEEALRHAMEQTGAAGGDLLLTDPRTGEILAAVSRRRDGRRQWSAAIEPYEPGSTLKPFLVAALLADGHATLDDLVFAEHGRYVERGRTIRDVHGYGWLTLRDALRYSSNVAMAKMSERLEPAEQYGYLRDFGFGSPTGVTYPSESAGRLRRPPEWSAYSRASLAIGYEIAVTPLQMALAYGVLGNGGVLMEPRLVREVRARDGRVIRQYPPQAVRRVLRPDIAAQLAATLAEAVESGTGQEASLGSFRVAGKTGTSRRVVGGRYEGNAYTASFAGFFPASDPQLAFLVKLDRPRGQYYGGLTAAPVTRATLSAALAARSTWLDKRAIVAASSAVVVPERGDGARAGGARSGAAGAAMLAASRVPDRQARWLPPAPGPFIFALDAGPPQRYDPAAPAPERVVPRVRGLPLRDAVRRLHAQGFAVRVEGSGAVATTVPGPGVAVAAGSIVVVRGREGPR